MMKLTLVTVGKLKERYFSDAVAEYTKRLSRFCKTEILELQDEKTPEGASAREEQLIKEKEGERILSHLRDDSYVIALAIEGKKMSSEQFSELLSGCMLRGCSRITFVIGGSLGLDSRVLSRADLLLSFSDMTFPHQLMRVILLEQIYRAFKISANEPYHK